MTITEFIAHIVFFAGPGVLVLAWQEINELPMKRWSGAGS